MGGGKCLTDNTYAFLRNYKLSEIETWHNKYEDVHGVFFM